MDSKNEIGRGGDAGEVFIAARKIMGDGKILANGGDGSIGGKGGKVRIISDDYQFTGEISAQGGKSLIVLKRWWEKTWVQIIILLGALAGIVSLYALFR